MLNFHSHIKNSLHPLLCKNSKLNMKNKKILYTSIIRPVITYAAPAWCHLKPRPLRPLQNFQNKILRLVTNKTRFTRISNLHEIAQIESIRDHITRISERFYDSLSHLNDTTKSIVRIRSNNIHPSHEHPLPYQFLSIFQKPPWNPKFQSKLFARARNIMNNSL